MLSAQVQQWIRGTTGASTPVHSEIPPREGRKITFFFHATQSRKPQKPRKHLREQGYLETCCTNSCACEDDLSRTHPHHSLLEINQTNFLYWRFHQEHVSLYIYSSCINGSSLLSWRRAMIASEPGWWPAVIKQSESAIPKRSELARKEFHGSFRVVRELLNSWWITSWPLASLCTAQVCNSFSVKPFFIFSSENSRE